MKISCLASFVLLFALTSAAQTNGHPPQTDSKPLACAKGYHEASWLQLPLNDVPGEPVIPRQEVKVCFPNCPKGYRQVPGSADTLVGHPACLLAESDETNASGCMPLNFELVYQRAIPLVWHWRAEISEKCAAVLLKSPIEPQYYRVAEDLHGEGTAHFFVTVGKTGRVINSELIDFSYTTLPPPGVSKVPLSRELISSLAAHTLKQLKFEPYLFRQEPTQVQSRVTILFKLKKEPQ
jgi:hypothetical protein